MKKTSLYEKLEMEKAVLTQLADEALKNGIPFTQYDKFMDQNRKIDSLILEIQKEKERNRKNNRNDKATSQQRSS
ncbi:hypothetical protein [Desulforamulus aquiferis]|uniref:Uncharacterized protein n=1 Tax=Desulforamulus aquiferis TaxID=1397668 RepID=A0AAW7ZH54_9FIRM|nr:hypothetical protein [Desulforamulus aquiferis]MDO7788160.1 hypothetical protein [Desulforamulus aquiferis]